MKKSKIILSVLTPIAAVAATAGIVASSLTLSSCSNSKKWNPAISTYTVNLKKQSTFAADGTVEGTTPSNPVVQDRPTILPTPSVDNVQGDTSSIDANFNQNPFIQLQKKFGNNVNGLIEEDLNDIILEFLSCMEQEDKVPGQKRELELSEKEDIGWKNPIQVVKAQFDKDFLTTKKITVTANVMVDYEIKVNGKKEEGRKLVNDVTFDLYTEFAGKDEVLSLTEKVAGKKEQGVGGGKEVDYEDIMELLVGERKSKDPFDFDFDDIFEQKDSSIDEIGLLKYMSNYNDLTNANAKMFGYSFDINEFWTDLITKWNQQNPAKPKKLIKKAAQKSDFYFWAPSSAVCNIFVPELNGANINTSVQKIKDKYKTTKFDGLQQELTTLTASSNAPEYATLKTWLTEIGVSLPNNTNFSKVVLKTKTDAISKVKKLELEITDQFGNEFDFEFYSNWWKATPKI